MNKITKNMLLRCLRKLNKHYQRKVKFRTSYRGNGADNPCAYPYLQTIFFPPNPNFYDERILAHEYAHLLDNDLGNGRTIKDPEASHDKEFEAVYQEVCSVLGVFALPTKELMKQLPKSEIASRRSIEGPHNLWKASVEFALSDSKSLQVFCKEHFQYSQYEETLEDLIRALEREAVTAANM